MNTSLIIPAFIAGLLTFLAPCTFPLLPAYISFIGGTSVQELQNSKNSLVRRKIFLNGVFYVLGFSLVFIALGSLFGLGGGALFQYRNILTKVGGVLVIIFGLFMTGLLNIPALNFLNYEKRPIFRSLKPGTPVSALLFGATFAVGWTPCVGPVLGSILTLAAASATVAQGAFLLGVFSLGLAIPFLIIAASSGWAFAYLKKVNRYLHIISVIGGILLIILGILLLTGQFASWINYFYRFNVVPYDKLLKYF